MRCTSPDLEKFIAGSFFLSHGPCRTPGAQAKLVTRTEKMATGTQLLDYRLSSLAACQLPRLKMIPDMLHNVKKCTTGPVRALYLKIQPRLQQHSLSILYLRELVMPCAHAIRSVLKHSAPRNQRCVAMRAERVARFDSHLHVWASKADGLSGKFPFAVSDPDNFITRGQARTVLFMRCLLVHWCAIALTTSP